MGALASDSLSSYWIAAALVLLWRLPWVLHGRSGSIPRFARQYCRHVFDLVFAIGFVGRDISTSSGLPGNASQLSPLSLFSRALHPLWDLWFHRDGRSLGCSPLAHGEKGVWKTERSPRSGGADENHMTEPFRRELPIAVRRTGANRNDSQEPWRRGRGISPAHGEVQVDIHCEYRFGDDPQQRTCSCSCR